MASLRNRAGLLTAIYCAAAGLAGVVSIVAIALRYGSMGDTVPLHLLPWGASLADVEKNLFHAFRLPVMGLCLQGTLLGLYPDRMDGWPDDAYSAMRSLLMGLSLVALSQLTLNPQLTMGGGNAVLRGIVLCVMLAAGLAVAVMGAINMYRLLKPRCGPQQTPYVLLLDFVSGGCRRRRVLLIASVTAFIVLLVLPAFRY